MGRSLDRHPGPNSDSRLTLASRFANRRWSLADRIARCESGKCRIRNTFAINANATTNATTNATAPAVRKTDSPADMTASK